MHGVARTMKISIVLLVVVTRSSLSFCCAFSTSGAEARWAVKSSLTLHSTTARDRHQFGDNDLTVTTTTKERQPSQRQIVKVEKFARLPVWPVWQGVFLCCI